eukprot:SAG31_NODE_2865_length_4981_cov_4.988529_2_plen_95_part_00
MVAWVPQNLCVSEFCERVDIPSPLKVPYRSSTAAGQQVGKFMPRAMARPVKRAQRTLTTGLSLPLPLSVQPLDHRVSRSCAFVTGGASCGISTA